MVANLQAKASERDFVPERFFETELGGVKASLFCDHAETHGTKTLRLVQYKRGRPKDEDHRDPELALLRKAATEQHPDKKIEISLLYLESGEEKPVPHKATFENRRILKLERAARALQASDFPPAPNDRSCPTCPFLFLCPA
jgi:hypothetical protein